MTNHPPFRYFKTSPEATRLAVMLYVRFPLSLRNVEDLLHERGVGVSHEKSLVLVELPKIKASRGRKESLRSISARFDGVFARLVL